MAIKSKIKKNVEKKLVSVGNPKVVIFIIGAFRQSRAYAESHESSLVLTQDYLYFVTKRRARGIYIFWWI